MILHVYALKNRLSGIYEKPITEVYDSVEYSELLTSSLASAPVDVLARHKEYDVYEIGSFDSKTGILSVIDNQFVLSLESVCLSYIKSKEGKSDERSESC